MVGIPSDTTGRTGSSCEEKKIFQNIPQPSLTFLQVQSSTGAGVRLVCSATDLVNVRVLVVRQEGSHQEGGRQEAGADEGVEGHGEGPGVGILSDKYSGPENLPGFLRSQQGDDQTGVCRAERSQGEDLQKAGRDQDGEAGGEGEEDHDGPRHTDRH